MPGETETIRPVAFPRDGLPVADLMEICFGDLLDSPSRAMLSGLRRWSNQGRVIWWLVRMLGWVQISDWLDGLGWYEDGRIVGNISITTGAFEPGAWLIGNVAVHPEYRQRGIARALVNTGLAEIRRRGGKRVFLQVDEGNESARRLYQESGFKEIAHRRTWERRVRSVPALETDAPVQVRLCRGEEWRQEYALLREEASAGIAWNLPLTVGQIHSSPLRRVERFLGEESEAHWLAWREAECTGVLISITRAWEEQLALFCRGNLPRETAECLLDRALLNSSVHRSVSLETDASLPAEAVQGFGFQPQRSLIWMALSLS